MCTLRATQIDRVPGLRQSAVRFSDVVLPSESGSGDDCACSCTTYPGILSRSTALMLKLLNFVYGWKDFWEHWKLKPTHPGEFVVVFVFQLSLFVVILLKATPLWRRVCCCRVLRVTGADREADTELLPWLQTQCWPCCCYLCFLQLLLLMLLTLFTLSYSCGCRVDAFLVVIVFY